MRINSVQTDADTQEPVFRGRKEKKHEDKGI